jgi:hypothetical protein
MVKSKSRIHSVLELNDCTMYHHSMYALCMHFEIFNAYYVSEGLTVYDPVLRSGVET